MFRSLRGNLILLWFFVAVVCCALAFQLHGVFELGVGGEIAQVRHSVERSAAAVQQEFSLYLASFSEAPSDFNDVDRRRELQLLLDLALGQYYGIEGGFWSPQSKFTAYSFPTHDPVKRDVPEAEAGRIATLNERVLSKQKEEINQFDSSGEVLLLHAVPVRPDLVIWTMGRAHVRAAAAFEKLTTGFIVLFLLMLVTGALILWYLHRWGLQLYRIEEQLAKSPSDSELPKTGLKELDRLIIAFNRQTDRLRQLQQRSNDLGAELGRAERLAGLGRMSAGLAHEIRNPIGAMRLQAENALAKADLEASQKACRTILRDISRIDDLLERLLAPETAWPLDERQLSRALCNLVANALQHTPPAGWISVSAEIVNGQLEIAVEDSGPGVPDELKGKIFDPFASYRSEGTGLGLSIVRQIVEAHGGTIRCLNGRIGARFEMKIPWREI